MDRVACANPLNDINSPCGTQEAGSPHSLSAEIRKKLIHERTEREDIALINHSVTDS